MDAYKKSPKYLKAKNRVKEIKRFYNKLIFYGIFILGISGLNYYLNQWREPWFLWAVFGVGIGVFFQAMNLYKWPVFLSKKWENRKIAEFMEKDEELDNRAGDPED